VGRTRCLRKREEAQVNGWKRMFVAWRVKDLRSIAAARWQGQACKARLDSKNVIQKK
jgi:hypothetical protein